MLTRGAHSSPCLPCYQPCELKGLWENYNIQHLGDSRIAWFLAMHAFWIAAWTLTIIGQGEAIRNIVATACISLLFGSWCHLLSEISSCPNVGSWDKVWELQRGAVFTNLWEGPSREDGSRQPTWSISCLSLKWWYKHETIYSLK